MIRSNGSVALVGKAALVTEREAGCSYAGYLMRLRPKQVRVVPEYLHLALQTYDVRVQIELPARSTSGVHNINSEEVMALRVRVPAREAQGAAVREVGRLFALADTIEHRVQAATARAEKLPHAILSRAFSGDLVPTEAELARAEGRTYETAEGLLARTSARSQPRAAASGAQPRRRQRRVGT
jgi:type I restriction enzyme S subunit